MKALIFLIFIVLVVSGMIWKMRKSQAEADLARRKSIKRRREEEKETITSLKDQEWPTIIRTVKGHDPSESVSDAEELAMAAIEFEPSEHLATQQKSSTKTGTYQ